MHIASIVCFLPLIPAFIYAWYVGYAAQRQVDRSSKHATSTLAYELLESFLRSVNLNDVKVTRGENYLKNEYDASENAIELSPDVIDSIDVHSLALALRAGAQAATAKQRPHILATLAKIRNAQTLLFWTTFCILSFGIMASSYTISAIGYAVLACVYFCAHTQRNLKREIDDVAIAFMRKSKVLPEAQQEELERVFAAQRRLD